MASRVVETVIWSALACGAWLTTLSSATPPEVCFALAAAVPAALAARGTRRLLSGGWTMRVRWAILPMAVVVTAVAEVAAVLRAAVTGRSGELLRLPIEGSGGREPVEGRAAAFILATSATPGSLVVQDDRDHRRFSIHRLASAGPRVESMITRVVAGESVVDR